MTDRSFPPYVYDDDLIAVTRRDGQTRVRVYRLRDTAVVLGSGSRAALELDHDACRTDGVPTLRRRGGGCAVVLDPGQVIVSVAAAGLPFGHHRRHFDLLSAWLIDGLARIGFTGISQAGVCDLVVGERKIAGACLHRSRDLLYYSASLLIAPDFEKIARYLRHPPREPDYRRGRPHSSFVGSLADLASSKQRPKAGSVGGAEQVAAQLRYVLEAPILRDPAENPRAAGVALSPMVETEPGNGQDMGTTLPKAADQPLPPAAVSEFCHHD